MRPFERWLAADILTLGMAADEARRAAVPGGPVVTYRRVHIVTPGDLEGPGEWPAAATELRLYEAPGTLDAALAWIRLLRTKAGSRRVSAFSMADLEAGANAGWGPLDRVLSALVGAGMSDVAEMPVDRLPDLTASLHAARAAGLDVRRITMAAPPGERRLELLARIRSDGGELPRPCYVAPLPRQVPADKPTTGYDDLRLIALARLMLGAGGDEGPPMHIEVDWSLYGPKLAQVALTFGADHLDAVSALSDGSLGPRRGAVEDVERNIKAAGFEPREDRGPR